jgi:hypothetical protein
LQKSHTTIEMIEIRAFIKQCQCPFCEDNRIFKSLAGHVTTAHGISAYELRELAGIGRSKSICSKEYHQEKVEVGKQRDVSKMLKAGVEWSKLGLPRDDSLRAETREKFIRNANDPNRKERFRYIMSTVTHEERSQANKNVSLEINEARTKRIKEAHKKILANPDKRRAYINSILDNRKTLAHEVYVKAGKAAAKRRAELRKNPEWVKSWKDKIIKSKVLKVPKIDYPVIIQRRAMGESLESIAKGYGCTDSNIVRIIKGYCKI